MSDRNTLARAFVDSTDWAGASFAPLAGDASNRRYLRISHPAGNDTAVLMDAPPNRGEDVRPFIQIAKYLIGIGLSAPRILAQDTQAGFLLLEDLGDDLFASVIQRRPQIENRLYSCAADLLVTLHNETPPENLHAYDPPLMADLAALAFDWYLPAATAPSPNARGHFHAAMLDALQRHAAECRVLIQRDYHAQNLLWLPDRAGVTRVGLLDFQDAMLGHPAYDLVSLLQDARRDVPPDIEAAMIDRYIAATQTPPESFRTAYAVLGAQRNLRILGVFTRLCVRDGKAHYVGLIPRVWELLQRNLAHPALADVTAILSAVLPQPNPAILQKVKDQCSTPPQAVMLFAAGFGTRMAPLTDDRPKPMIPVAGRPLIDHALDLVREYGPETSVANVHYKPQPLIDHFKGSEVVVTHETPDILDTGGGLRAALPYLGDGPVFTMNTDAVWSGPNPLQQLAATWDPNCMDALLLCLPRENAIGHDGPGDFMQDDNGCAKRGPGAVYSGLQILKTDMLHDIPETAFSLNIVWDHMLAKGRLFITTYPGRWCDVGRPDGIVLAETLLGYNDV